MSMTSIGEKLRQAREKKALTVEQVQKQTLIHSTVVTALEDGRCDDMLTPTYVKSFLKKYSNFLGLDPKEIIGEYSTSHSTQPAAKPNIDTAKPAASKRPEIKRPNIFLPNLFKVAAVLIATLALAFFLIVGVRALLTFVKNMPHTQKTAVKTKKGMIKAEKAAPKKKNADKSAARQSKAMVPQNVPLNIIIKVKAPVWVELTKDGEKLFQRVLPRGMEESIVARDKVELYVANGDVIEVFLNGKSLGSPGRGVIKNIEITRFGMKVK